MTLRPFARAALAAALAVACAVPAAARNLPAYDAQTAEPGVPKFLWAKDAAATIAKAPQPRLATDDDEGRARAHLSSVAGLYRITAGEVDALPLANVQRFPDGGAIVRFGNAIDGIEVFREQVSVLADKRGDLVAIGGFALGAPIAARKTVDTPDLGQASAVGRALADHGFAGSVAQGLLHVKDEGGYAWLTLSDGATAPDGSSLAAPIRAKRVWFRMPGELVPAWYVEVQVRDGASPKDIDAYSYVVSAVDGALLFRKSLTQDAFSYRVFAEPATPNLPWPNPTGRAAFPHPAGTPNGFQPPFVTPSLVTLDSAPFSKSDPWLASTANRTTGNNVDAFADLLEPDGFGTAGVDQCNLALPADGDLHACTTSASAFDHTYNPNLAPNASRPQVAAAVTNLFYVINYLHDWFYDAGFNEAAANAQLNNFARGGVANDSITAEAMDYAGINNANMTTPADGARPRMRMYMWSSGVALVKVIAPAAVAGIKDSATADFGAQAFDFTGDVVIARDAANTEGPVDTDACSPLTNASAVAGKIALVDRGVCTFVVKVKNVQDAGAIGALIVNNVSPGLIGMAGSDATITIPALSITSADGAQLKTQLAQSAKVSARMARQSAPSREGSLDNTTVAHEWGHYLSNRLIGNAAGLNAKIGGGMGEGWSDFVSLLLFVKEADRAVAGNASFDGIYTQTAYSVAGPDFAPDVLNNAYYYGIRRYPYTRDMSKDPLTFKHISDGVALPATPPPSPRGSSSANSEAHNTGEVWASMLWECYSNLLNDTGRLTFTQAQDRMKRYLVASLKMTPLEPTFVTGRDALLAVMQAQDSQDHDLCLAGFAKRGLGIGAIAPNILSESNVGVVESFHVTADAGLKAVAFEYYNAGFDHYFVTHIADEITKLDNGTLVGWTRTGESFSVYADVPAGSASVCRFFSTAFGLRSSHFYTPDVGECATVKQNPKWQFEGDVFAVPLADAAGNCSGAALPVYRLYNDGQGGAPNHRYTTSLATRSTMLGKGWIPEGSGPLGVIMCAP